VCYFDRVVNSADKSAGTDESEITGLSEINGSVNFGNEIRDFVNENVNISLVTAAENAQSQLTNGTVIGGHLGVVQGYLVYKFITVNVENQTGYITLIDAGNSNEL
jgi:hypothetical protein